MEPSVTSSVVVGGEISMKKKRHFSVKSFRRLLKIKKRSRTLVTDTVQGISDGNYQSNPDPVQTGGDALSLMGLQLADREFPPKSIKKPTSLPIYRYPVGVMAPIATIEVDNLGDSHPELTMEETTELLEVHVNGDVQSLPNGTTQLYASGDDDEAIATWKKLRDVMVYTPFIQKSSDGHEKYPWVQLAGHQGNFKPGQKPGTILKKWHQNEADCLQAVLDDPLSEYVPKFFEIVQVDAVKYIEMEDLLANFTSPYLMDCKIGVRTYMESELAKARSDPKARHDMYLKMVEVDPDAPTEEERATETVTKPRYMVFREELSSSSNLSFRIDGIQKAIPRDQKPGQEIPKPCPFNLKRVKTSEQIIQALSYFTDGNRELINKFIVILENLVDTLKSSEFFAKHEVIGSSLLFVYDNSGQVGIWMIDFGKTHPCPVTINHTAEWIEGNHEDGYLTGVLNLMDLMRQTCNNSS